MKVKIPASVDLTKEVLPEVKPFGFYSDILTEGIWLPAVGEDGVEARPYVVVVKKGAGEINVVDFELTKEVEGRELAGTFPSSTSNTFFMTKKTIQLIQSDAKVHPKETDKRIEELLERHVFLKDQGSKTVVKRFIEGTYFHDVFDHYPILFIYGVSESGKSRLLKVVMFASYHGSGMVDPTEASIFRTKEEERTTLCIDEAERLFNPKNPAYQTIQTLLNASYSRYYTVPRYDEVSKDERRIRHDYSLYSPLALCSTETLPGITLSRTVRIISYRVERDYPDPHPDDFAAFRDEMYYHRLTRAFEVRDEYEKTYAPLTGRFSELFRPLFTLTKIFGQEGEMELLLDFAKKYEDSMRIEADNISREEEVLTILMELVGAGPGNTEEWMPIKEVVDRASVRGHDWKPKTVSTILTKLGLEKRKRTNKGVCFAYTPRQVSEIASRLGILSEESVESVESEEKLGSIFFTGSGEVKNTYPRNSTLSSLSSLSSPSDTPIKTPESSQNTTNSNIRLEGNKDDQLHIKETEIPKIEGSIEPVRETLCPPWIPSEEWERLSQEEKERVLKGRDAGNVGK